MLTLILLVVLGGGAGLMTVWLVDARGLSQLLGRSEGRSLRRARGTPTAGKRVARVPDRVRDVRFEPLIPPSAHPLPRKGRAPVPDTGAVATYQPVEVPEALPGPSPRRDGKRVPAAYTAVEGSYRDVARVPVWRKLVSLMSLIGILVVAGVTIAALAAASLGAVAELVDSAVG